MSGGAVGKDDVRTGLLDGNGPFIAGDIPVELVVVVEESDSVRDYVFDIDSASAVVCVGNIDFKFKILAIAAGFVFEFVAVLVGDMFDVEKQSE